LAGFHLSALGDQVRREFVRYLLKRDCEFLRIIACANRRSFHEQFDESAHEGRPCWEVASASPAGLRYTCGLRKRAGWCLRGTDSTG